MYQELVGASKRDFGGVPLQLSATDDSAMLREERSVPDARLTEPRYKNCRPGAFERKTPWLPHLPRRTSEDDYWSADGAGDGPRDPDLWAVGELQRVPWLPTDRHRSSGIPEGATSFTSSRLNYPLLQVPARGVSRGPPSPWIVRCSRQQVTPLHGRAEQQQAVECTVPYCEGRRGVSGHGRCFGSVVDASAVALCTLSRVFLVLFFMLEAQDDGGHPP